MSGYSLVVNREALLENYLPQGIVGRQREVQQVMRGLYPATRGRKPLHVWIHGDSGTGKTALAQFVLSGIRRRHSVETAYIDCWQHNTLFKVVDALTQSLCILGAEQHDTVFKLRRLEKRLNGRPFIILLDDIDRAFPKDRTAIIHGLCNLGKTELVCISHKEDTFYSLPPAIRARLNPQFVECRGYSKQKMMEILDNRQHLALMPNACSKNTLEKIACLSRGDARRTWT